MLEHFLSPDQKAEPRDVSDSDRLEAIAAMLRRLVEIQEPGVKGIEGAEAIPELQFDAVEVRDDVSRPIPANHRRTSILFHNLGPGVVYLVDHHVTDTDKGMPIPVNAEREVRTTNTLWLIAESSKTADVRVLEESS